MFTVSLSEPSSARYLYIDEKTNKVHLFLPVVSGEEIGLDNTCKTAVALKDFFDHADNKNSALYSLSKYCKILQDDLDDVLFLNCDQKLLVEKQARLEQLHILINTIERVRKDLSLACINEVYPRYPEAINTFLARRDNLFSMQLRPAHQDSFLRSQKPVFAVGRVEAFQKGIYGALRKKFSAKERFSPPKTVITELIKAIKTKNPALNKTLTEAQIKAHFDEIVGIAQQHAKSQFDKEISLSMPVDDILAIIGLDDDNPTITLAELVTAIIKSNLSQFTIDGLMPQSHFSKVIHPEHFTVENKEKLSILVQFFLAQINIYCFANQLTTENHEDFSVAMEKSGSICQRLTDTVHTALTTASSVEDALINFINEISGLLKLSRALTPDDAAKIREKFNRTYASIESSPHFDEFLVFYPEKPGTFVSYQGSIACQFSEFMCAAFPSMQTAFFRTTMNSYDAGSRPPNSNGWVKKVVQLNDSQRAYMDNAIKNSLQMLLKWFPRIPAGERVDYFLSLFPEATGFSLSKYELNELLHLFQKEDWQKIINAFRLSTDKKSLVDMVNHFEKDEQAILLQAMSDSFKKCITGCQDFSFVHEELRNSKSIHDGLLQAVGGVSALASIVKNSTDIFRLLKIFSESEKKELIAELGGFLGIKQYIQEIDDFYPLLGKMSEQLQRDLIDAVGGVPWIAGEITRDNRAELIQVFLTDLPSDLKSELLEVISIPRIKSLLAGNEASYYDLLRLFPCAHKREFIQEVLGGIQSVIDYCVKRKLLNFHIILHQLPEDFKLEFLRGIKNHFLRSHDDYISYATTLQVLPTESWNIFFEVIGDDVLTSIRNIDELLNVLRLVKDIHRNVFAQDSLTLFKAIAPQLTSYVNNCGALLSLLESVPQSDKLDCINLLGDHIKTIITNDPEIFQLLDLIPEQHHVLLILKLSLQFSNQRALSVILDKLSTDSWSQYLSSIDVNQINQLFPDGNAILKMLAYLPQQHRIQFLQAFNEAGPYLAILVKKEFGLADAITEQLPTDEQDSFLTLLPSSDHPVLCPIQQAAKEGDIIQVQQQLDQIIRSEDQAATQHAIQQIVMGMIEGHFVEDKQTFLDYLSQFHSSFIAPYVSIWKDALKMLRDHANKPAKIITEDIRVALALSKAKHTYLKSANSTLGEQSQVGTVLDKQPEIAIAFLGQLFKDYLMLRASDSDNIQEQQVLLDQIKKLADSGYPEAELVWAVVLALDPNVGKKGQECARDWLKKLDSVRFSRDNRSVRDCMLGIAMQLTRGASAQIKFVKTLDNPIRAVATNHFIREFTASFMDFELNKNPVIARIFPKAQTVKPAIDAGLFRTVPRQPAAALSREVLPIDYPAQVMIPFIPFVR